MLFRSDKGTAVRHTLKDPENNGLYAFIISGEIDIEGQKLSARDALGLTEVTGINILALEHAEVLLMEVPMCL